MTSKPLPTGTPVTITRWRLTGYSGHVLNTDSSGRFYLLEVTHDPDGRPLAEPIEHGLYARKELRTDGPVESPVTTNAPQRELWPEAG